MGSGGVQRVLKGPQRVLEWKVLESSGVVLN